MSIKFPEQAKITEAIKAHQSTWPENHISMEGLHEGFPIYADLQTALLTEEFDPSSFRSSQLSGYRDASIEGLTGIFPEVAKKQGAFYGLTRGGWNKLTRGAAYGVDSLHGDSIGHVRVETQGHAPLYFPTPEMLISYGVKLRSLSGEQNAALGFIFSRMLRTLPELHDTLDYVRSDEYITEHPEIAFSILSLHRAISESTSWRY